MENGDKFNMSNSGASVVIPKKGTLAKDGADEKGPSENADTCGNCLPAVEEIACLSGLAGFSCEYVSVFLVGKNVYKTQNFKRGIKNS